MPPDRAEAISRTDAFVGLITPHAGDEPDTFTTNPGGGMPTARMNGGVVMAQCLMAAGARGPLKIAHSMHAQFLRPGDSTQPVKISVRAVRDSKNFRTTHVIAAQSEGAVLEAWVSFTAPREGIEHRFAQRPEVAAPEAYEEQDMTWMEWHATEWRVPRYPVRTTGDDPTFAMWCRPMSPLPADPLVHAAAIVYQTDMPTSKYLTDYHGIPVGVQASLDHALWFHGEPRWEGWHLWSLVSPRASNSRALIQGQLFDDAGELVASVAQEALYRA